MRFDRLEIFQAAGRKIVNDDDSHAIRQQPFDQMRTDEAGAARDQNVFHTFIRLIIEPASRFNGSTGPRFITDFVSAQRVCHRFGQLLAEFRGGDQLRLVRVR